MNVIKVKISDITIGERFRKDMGDLKGLAQSISEGELLHPIGITPDNDLVFGERRLRAYRDILGRDTIPARIIDVPVLLGQFDENTLRKDFTITERIAIVEARRSFKHGGDRRSNQVRKVEDETLTLEDACVRAGLSKDSFYRAKEVEENGIPELVQAMDSGRLSIHAASTLAKASADEQRECLTKRLDDGRATARVIAKHVRRIRNLKEHEAHLARAIEDSKSDDTIQIHHCPFQNLEQMAGIEPESVQLVCTDIPYGQQFLDQLEDLAQFAERILMEGGIFVTYSGQYWLPDVMDRLRRHLMYRWQIASVWDGDASVVNPFNLLSLWKPILVFTKGAWKPTGRWPDVLRIQSKEKDWHPWQQPLEEIEKLVTYFSKPGDLVVDPCSGGFTTAIACLKNHRRFIGCDIDHDAVAKGQERLELERRPQVVKPKAVEADSKQLAG